MKDATRATVWFIVIFNVAWCSSANSEEVDTKDSVPEAELVKFRESVTTWEAETKIPLSESATRALEMDWINLGNELNNQGVKPDLARAYLYQVRDTQGLDKKESAVVSLRDIQALPLRTYTEAASFGRDYGFLRCVSTPEGGTITIDGDGHGITSKELTLGVGTYTVGIELTDTECVETIHIEKNSLAKLECPSTSTK